MHSSNFSGAPHRKEPSAGAFPVFCKAPASQAAPAPGPARAPASTARHSRGSAVPLCRKAPGPIHPHSPDTPPLSTPLPAAMPTGVQDRCGFQISAAEPRPAQAVHRNTAHTPHPDAPARAPASVPAALEDGVCTPAPARIRHMDRKSPKPHRRKGSGAGTEYPRTAQTAALIFSKSYPSPVHSVSSRIRSARQENRLFLRTLRTICATSALWPARIQSVFARVTPVYRRLR